MKRMKWFVGGVLLLSQILVGTPAMAVITWQQTGGLLGAELIQTLAINPANPQTLYAGTTNAGVFKSTNGGNSWDAVNNGLSETCVFSLAIDPANPLTVYAATHSGMVKSDNGGVSWRAVNNGLPEDVWYVSVLSVDPVSTRTIYVGTDKGLFKSDDGGENWGEIDHAWVHGLAIDPTNSLNLYTLVDNFVYKSTDGGNSWETASRGLTGNDDIYALVIDRQKPNVLYAGTDFGVFKTTDGGGHWRAVNKGLTDGYAPIDFLVFDPNDTQTLLAFSEPFVHKSSNGGGSWKFYGEGPMDGARTVVVDPTNFETIYAGSFDGSVYKGASLDLPVISVDSRLNDGMYGASFSEALMAWGGTKPFTWSVVSGNLPEGIMLNATNGVLKGTPREVGEFTFTVKVVDKEHRSGTKEFYLTIVNSQFAITTDSQLPTATFGVRYKTNLTAVGGTKPYRWSVISGALPDGFTLDAGTGTLRGKLTVDWPASFTVQVVDKYGNSATKYMWLNIFVPPVKITTAATLPNGRVGAYYKKVLAAKGGVKPYVWWVISGDLPEGLTLDESTGIISGAPESAGIYTFWVQALGEDFFDAAQKAFTLTVKE